MRTAVVVFPLHQTHHSVSIIVVVELKFLACTVHACVGGCVCLTLYSLLVFHSFTALTAAADVVLLILGVFFPAALHVLRFLFTRGERKKIRIIITCQ